MTDSLRDAAARFAAAMRLTEQGRIAEAEPILAELARRHPGEMAVQVNYAGVLARLGHDARAAAIWQRAAQAGSVEAAVNLGVLRRRQGDLTESIRWLEQAVASQPASADAWFQLGHSFQIARRNDEAIAAFEAALARRPDHAQASLRLLQLRQDVCDFAGVERLMPAVARAVAGASSALTPWQSLRLPIDRGGRLAVARAHARAAAARVKGFDVARRTISRSPPWTIGYLSADFRHHPLMALTADMYALHDRTRFRINAYSLRPTDGSADAARVSADVDRFVDLSATPLRAAIDRIAADGVDILVDLSGFSTGTRPEILAARPSPLQVSWLGWAGPGSRLLYDYVLADAVVIPQAHFDGYDEAVVWLPHGYQMNPPPLAPPQPPPRSELGLPPDAVVLACLCAGEKIDAARFGHWMRILAQTPGTVLWLLGDSAAMRTNLARAAARAGIAPERLVFAPPVERAAHLARIAAADLMVDTRIYGGHTTASDSLRVGVPVVTQLGDQFPARVAASLLTGLRLEECIADDDEAYVALVTALARDRVRLKSIAARLRAGAAAPQSPFDTPALVAALERAYAAMIDYALAGTPPGHFRVA